MISKEMRLSAIREAAEHRRAQERVGIYAPGYSTEQLTNGRKLYRQFALVKAARERGLEADAARVTEATGTLSLTLEKSAKELAAYSPVVPVKQPETFRYVN